MRLTESYLALGIPEEARRAAAVLGANYPQHRLVSSAPTSWSSATPPQRPRAAARQRIPLPRPSAAPGRLTHAAVAELGSGSRLRESEASRCRPRRSHADRPLDPRRRADRDARPRIRAGPRRAHRRDRGGQVDPARRARAGARRARRQRPGARRPGAGVGQRRLRARPPAIRRWPCSTRTGWRASRASRWSSAASSRPTAAAAPSSTTSRSRPALLRELGALLVEIHGQHDDRGLLNPRGHRALLDGFGADRRRRRPARPGARVRGGRGAARRRRARRTRRPSATATGSPMPSTSWTGSAPEPGEEEALAEPARDDAGGRAARRRARRRSRRLLQGSDGGLAQLRQAARRLDRIAGEHDAARPRRWRRSTGR